LIQLSNFWYAALYSPPGWVMKTLVGLLVIGFIPALGISWVFELTPDGLRREDEVAPAEPIDATEPNIARRMNRMIMVLMALALGYFAFDKFVLAPSRDSAREQAAKVSAAPDSALAVTASQPEAANAIDTKSIAVLAFANIAFGD
jgi:adenylate cyclase